MKAIIQKLFKDKDYETLYEKKDFIFYKKKELEDNYIVVFYNGTINKVKIEEYLINLYEKNISKLLKENKVTEAFEKNISLILLINPVKIKEDQIRKITYSIEESKIYFKRYVIEYNSSEKQEFLKKFSKIDNLLNEFDQEIKKIENFEKYKQKKESFYNLLIKLYIKIPFLEFKFNKENLVEQFKNNLILDLSEDLDLNNKLKKYFSEENYNLSSLEEEFEITEDEILSKLEELGAQNEL